MFKLNNSVKLNSTFGRSQKRQFNPLQYSPALWLDASDQSTLTMDGAASFTAASSQSLSKASTSLSNNDEDIWVSLWAKTSSDATQGIFGKWNYSADGEYLLSKISATTLRFTRLTSAGQISTDITYSMTIGSWFHIFLTHDKTNNYYKLFINNALVTTINYTGTVTATANPFVLGWNSNAGYFNGFIDSAAFGKSASGWINSNAVALASYLYNSGAGRRSSDFINSSYYTGGNPSGAVSWWDLDERSGTRKDRIGTNDLTDNNSVGYASGIASGLVQYDGDPIKQWSDKSGNGRHATAASDAKRPTFKKDFINGRNTILTDGVDDVLSSATDMTQYTGLTIFGVYRYISGGSGAEVNNYGSSTGGVQFFTANGTDGYLRARPLISGSYATAIAAQKSSVNYSLFHVMTGTYGATTGVSVYVDGTIGSVTSSTTSTRLGGETSFYIGHNTNYSPTYGSAHFAELIIYPIELSSSKRQQVERYLGNKWGITVL